MENIIKLEKKEGTLSMIIAQGLWVVGRIVGGNKMLKPRVFQVIENGQRIQMSPLPGTPPFVRIPIDAMSYPIPEREVAMIDLYERVTDPKVDPTPSLN